MRRIYITPRRKRRRSTIAPFIIGAIIFHLLLLLFAIIYNIDIFQDKIAKNEEKQPEFIEITEIPVPKEKETEPPEQPKRLAKRSHTAPEEKTRDNITKPAVVVPPQPKPVPQRQPKPEPQKQQPVKAEKEVEKKPEHKVASKQPSDNNSKLDINEARNNALESLRREKLKKEAKKQQKKVEDITKDDLFSAPLNTSPTNPQYTPDYLGARDVQKKEDTVDLSTTEFKYVSYFIKLKRRIEGVWNYPAESRYRGERGQLLLVFSLNRNGTLADIQMLTSSGYVRLDNEAIRAIKVAAPYAPFPDQWGSLEKLNIRAVFEYGMGRIY